MRSFIASLSFCTLSAFAAASPFLDPANAVVRRDTCSEPVDPFHMTYLFTANLTLGPASKPIPVPGGALIDEDILGGTVTGPAINATISGGLAYPLVYQNNTLQVPQIVAYGSADDGTPFSLVEAGTGTPDAQVTRIQFSIGGGDKYKSLRDGYVLASINRLSAANTLVRGYLVTNCGTV